MVVQTLASDAKVAAGEYHVEWNGRRDEKNVVPDEAYTVRLALKSTDGKTSTYDPAENRVVDGTTFSAK